MDNYVNPADEPIPETEGMYTELIRFLRESGDMRNTAKSSIQQSLWAGGGALMGGLLLGPLGGLVGGVTGSLVGFFRTGDYDGVLTQITNLNPQQRGFLLADVAKVLMNAGATPQQLSSLSVFRDTLRVYAQQPAVRDAIWKSCLEAMTE
jgi:hypothetical protein